MTPEEATERAAGYMADLEPAMIWMMSCAMQFAFAQGYTKGREDERKALEQSK